MKLCVKTGKIPIVSSLILFVLFGFWGCLNDFTRKGGSNKSNPNDDFKSDRQVILGDERLFTECFDLIKGKNIGLVTNQTGANRKGELTWQKLAVQKDSTLVALYVPEHGLDGTTPAGNYVHSFIHKELNIPVYSLFGETRMPTPEMLIGVDLLLFDIQDIGSRAYTYISTLNYVMKAAAIQKIPVVILDRPNPLGDKVEGFVLDQELKSFVGIDALPLAHGMTVGELGRFFNRDIGADLTIVEMKNYFRNMIFSETGLDWIMTSPNIPDVESAFCYMATGMGDGTGVYMGDYFKWFAIRNMTDYAVLADLLNHAGLQGVMFCAENLNGVPGIHLAISDYRKFLPCTTSVYILSFAQKWAGCRAPATGTTLFEKLWGTLRMVQLLNERTEPQEIVSSWSQEVGQFLLQRKDYLIYAEK